jgi:hypothetical protein
MAPSEPRYKRIGFRVEEARPAYRTRRLRRAPTFVQRPSPLEGEGGGEGGLVDYGDAVPRAIAVMRTDRVGLREGRGEG